MKQGKTEMADCKENCPVKKRTYCVDQDNHEGMTLLFWGEKAVRTVKRYPSLDLLNHLSFWYQVPHTPKLKEERKYPDKRLS